MSEHKRKLDVFGQWYKLHKALKSIDSTNPQYQEISKKCDQLKREFDSLFCR